MYQATLNGRSFFIDDEEIKSRIGNDKLLFKPYKDKNGDVVIVAMRDGKGMVVFKGKRVRVNMPSTLKRYKGESVDVYIERLRPLSGEVFRVRPIDFEIEGCKSRKVATVPYTTETSLVLPQMYVNKVIKEGYYHGLSVSFSKTTESTLKDGYIIVYLTSTSNGKAYVDEYKLRECGSGIRTSKIVPTLNFLGRNKKVFSNYEFKGTLDAKGYEHGLMFFREKV